jgi:glutathione S-transferase
MSMTFYYKPMSSATRVHWVLEELGVPYEKVKMNLDGDQKKPEYLKLNPNGKIPLLVIDGHPIFESLAQILYLAEAHGEAKGLFPKLGIERAEAFKWMTWVSVSVHDAIVRVILNGDRVPEEERNPKARERAVNELGGYVAILDQHLAGKSFVMGEAFSLVDCTTAGIVPMLTRFGVDTSTYKNVQAWTGRCMSRPALARAMQG